MLSKCHSNLKEKLIYYYQEYEARFLVHEGINSGNISNQLIL